VVTAHRGVQVVGEQGSEAQGILHPDRSTPGSGGR
jgi:hypothetical protein